MDELGKKGSIQSKTSAIATFSEQCHIILEGQPSNAKKAIDAVVIAALVTLFVFS